MARPELTRGALLAGLVLAGAASAEGYYVCQDPRTGKKSGQDRPCEAARELRNYAPASAAELKAREETARQSRRDFEQTYPGTYRPEEYMTAEELADYRARAPERAAEQERRNQAAAVETATRQAAAAEQRASAAESAARQAEAKAAAAEEAAANARRPVLVLPYSPQRPPPPRPYGIERPRQDKPRD